MNNVDDIKERIKFLMVQKGLNQRELAEKIGITTPAVNKWFAKGSIPKEKTNIHYNGKQEI